MAGRLTQFNVSDNGLIFKNTSTGDNTPTILTLASGETDIATDNIIGSLKFKATNTGLSGDALLVCGSIDAVSEGDFAADNNATKLSFKTGDSAVASEKMVLSSTGTLKLKETTSAFSDTPGFGQIWIKDNTPNDLYFTNDDGNDIQITSGSSLLGGSLNGLSDALIENNSIWICSDPSATTNGAEYNVAIGTNALDSITTGDYNTCIGVSAGTNITTGSNNTCVGYLALSQATTQNNNTAIGVECLKNNIANNNTGLGAFAGYTNTTGTDNVFIGKDSGYNSNGSNNVYLGTHSGYTNTSNNNTFIGYKAGYSVTSGNNTIIGYEASYPEVRKNTAQGGGPSTITLDASASGTDDEYNGYPIHILRGVGTGQLRTISDYDGTTKVATVSSAWDTEPDNTSAFSINEKDITLGTNNIIIGYQASGSSTTVSNEITLGNSNITSLRCNTTSISSLSDRRDKTDIIDCPYGKDFLNKLRPVEFTWKRRLLNAGDIDNVHNGKTRLGFIAQELQEAMPNDENEILDLVYKSNPERLEIRQGNLIPIIVQYLKELHATNKELRNSCILMYEKLKALEKKN